jgi:hypothetical protein
MKKLVTITVYSDEVENLLHSETTPIQTQFYEASNLEDAYNYIENRSLLAKLGSGHLIYNLYKGILFSYIQIGILHYYVAVGDIK